MWDLAQILLFSLIKTFARFTSGHIKGERRLEGTFSLGSKTSLKGSRQRERRGFGKVSNICSMSRTAAIDVLSFNLAVVFDFMYFRFRASKAK
jgi:hypothetical protein